jgi:GR25 family glycosyltransferase involved in LPS biosynthesis
MNFQELIDEFVDSSKVGIYTIHLEKASERVSLMTNLVSKLQTPIKIFPGVDGELLLKNGYTTRCAHRPNGIRGPGDVGCSVSHVNVLRESYSNNDEYAVIFEDDCIFNTTLDELASYLRLCKIYFNQTDTKWDLFLLANTGLIDFEMCNQFISRVKNFNGIHAFIISRKMMKTIIDLFDRTLEDGRIHSADGIFGVVLKDTTLYAYGMPEGEYFFGWDRKIYSYVLEGYRK